MFTVKGFVPALPVFLNSLWIFREWKLGGICDPCSQTVIQLLLVEDQAPPGMIMGCLSG